MSRAPRLAYPIPSCLKARVVSPIGWVGKSAKQMEMSIAVMTSSTTLLNLSVSKVPSSFKNFNKFKEAKLQEELSKDMYSEHGLDAVIFPCSGVVCQSLIVSSYAAPDRRIPTRPGPFGGIGRVRLPCRSLLRWCEPSTQRFLPFPPPP